MAILLEQNMLSFFYHTTLLLIAGILVLMRHLLSDQVDEREIALIQAELARVLEQNVAGDVVEFGCYVGTTSVFLARQLANTERQLYLYDSFEGLPPKSAADRSPVGEQFKEGELLATKRQLIRNLKQAGVPLPRIKKAWFSNLEERDIPRSISFAFLDGDYYESICDSLRLISSHLTSKATIIVDDYTNEALPGAARAVNEWRRGHVTSLHIEHSLAILRMA